MIPIILPPEQQDLFVEQIIRDDEELVCSKEDQAKIRPFAHKMDPKGFQDIVDNRFFDPTVSEVTSCLINSMTYIYSRFDDNIYFKPSDRVTNILNQMDELGSGVNGIVSILGRSEGTPLGFIPTSPGGHYFDPGEGTPLDGIIVKVSSNYKEQRSLLREYLIGSMLNKYRHLTPCFALVYGIIRCGTDMESPNTLCPSDGNDPLLLMEKIDGITFHDWLVKQLQNWHTFGRSNLDYLYPMLSILFYSLMLVNGKQGYIHGDLHTGNVMIKELTQEVCIPVNRIDNKGRPVYYMVKTKFIPVVIDYGFSRMLIEDRSNPGSHKYSIGNTNWPDYYDKKMHTETYSAGTPYLTTIMSDFYKILFSIESSARFFFQRHPEIVRHHIFENFFLQLPAQFRFNARSQIKKNNYPEILSIEDSKSIAPFDKKFYVDMLRLAEQYGFLYSYQDQVPPNIMILSCSTELQDELRREPNWRNINISPCVSETIVYNHLKMDNKIRTSNLPLLLDSIQQLDNIQQDYRQFVDEGTIYDAYDNAMLYASPNTFETSVEYYIDKYNEYSIEENIYLINNVVADLKNRELLISALIYLKKRFDIGQDIDLYIKWKNELKMTKIRLDEFVDNVQLYDDWEELKKQNKDKLL